MILAPSPARARAMARPMPEVEPVIRAVLPARNMATLPLLLSGEIEGGGAAVDDVACEQRVVAHRLGDGVEPGAPMMLHGRAREFEIGRAPLPAMLAIDEMDDV